MHWHVGPWVWSTDVGGSWNPPAGSLAALDLRTLPEMSVAGGSPGMGLFLTAARLGADYDYLGAGSWYDLKPTTRQRQALAFRTGQTAAGDDLVGMVLSLFSDEADPQGLDRPKPLMPTMEGRLELHVGQRHTERWKWNRGRGANRVKALLRSDFAGLMADAEAGRLKDAIHHRRVLDAWCEKYGVEDWQEFVPDALQPQVPGRVPHETTISESFNTADSDTLGPDLSWTELAGDIDIVSNLAQSTTFAAHAVARADSDLSSSDHYFQASLTTTNQYAADVIARKDSSATMTYYLSDCEFDGNKAQTYKSVSGSFTLISSTAHTFNYSTFYTSQIHCNGSTIKHYVDTVEKVSSTDTSISSGTRGGLRCYIQSSGQNAKWDSFTGSDLGGGGITYTQLERGIKGYCRGMYVGRI